MITSDFDPPGQINGIGDSVGANAWILVLALVLNFEPNTIQGGRLGEQTQKHVLNEEFLSWAFDHRCHQVLVLIFALVGEQYGIECKQAIKIARSVLVIINRTPYDGNSRLTDEDYEKYSTMCKSTDPIMKEYVFSKLPYLLANLKHLCLFGKHVHEARESIIDKGSQTDKMVMNAELLHHPEVHVRGARNLIQQKYLVNSCFSPVWAEMLGAKQITIGDQEIIDIFTRSRFTGNKQSPGEVAEWAGQWRLLLDTPGTLDERFRKVQQFKGDEYLSTIDEAARRYWMKKHSAYEKGNKAAIQDLMESGYDKKFLSCGGEEYQSGEYKRVYAWINGLRNRHEEGRLHPGELEMIEDMKTNFEIDFNMEVVEREREARMREVEENAERDVGLLFAAQE